MSLINKHEKKQDALLKDEEREELIKKESKETHFYDHTMLITTIMGACFVIPFLYGSSLNNFVNVILIIFGIFMIFYSIKMHNFAINRKALSEKDGELNKWGFSVKKVNYVKDAFANYVPFINPADDEEENEEYGLNNEIDESVETDDAFDVLSEDGVDTFYIPEEESIELEEQEIETEELTPEQLLQMWISEGVPNNDVIKKKYTDFLRTRTGSLKLKQAMRNFGITPQDSFKSYTSAEVLKIGALLEHFDELA